MSRPGSSARSIGGYQSEDGSTAGPSRSPAPEYYPHQPEGYRSDAPAAWDPVNGGPDGRVMYPMSGHPPGGHPVGPSGMSRQLPHGHDDSDFIPIEEAHYYQATPYNPHHHHHPPPHHQMHPQYMSYHPGSTPHSTSPTAMMGQHGHPMMHLPSHSPNDSYHSQSTPMPQHFYNAPMPRRPGMQQRHTAMGAPRPPPMQRGYSLQPPPTRGLDPLAQDVFAPLPDNTPIRRPSSAVTDYHTDCSQFFPTLTQGISPTRALGPAPSGKTRFSPSADPLITPQTKIATQAPSSGASTVMTASSAVTSNYSSGEHREEDLDSPTRPPKAAPAGITLDPAPRRQIVPPVRLNKTVIGGRTSAKFAKVAEDPGVEGVPPGPRPTERPTPSFACIIGQAILRCRAGGLSLEHIYRYVETAYPYFKSGDGAWRNSVRHNLSIHKMFETIPRTEKYPPGKGGIWIIHDEEKIHWPSEDKFIKNFPTTHPHHHVCRQTVHERAKESEAIAKARAEGREYVPKKGKKGRKFNDDCSTEMVRATSSMSDGAGPSSYNLHHPLPPVAMPLQMSIPVVKHESELTPPMLPKILHPPPFLRQLDEPQQPHYMLREDSGPPKGTMVPPRFGVQKRSFDGDEENVFTAPKRVRVAEPLPLAPIQQESVDDAYVTPERERQMGKAAMMMSSAFKTPGLVNSTSSPGSSPMPPTVLRTTQHPSSLQQTWTQADLTTNSSPPFSLDAAFDIKPKQRLSPALPSSYDDDLPPSTSYIPPASSILAPKTPLTRSSAVADRTPRLNNVHTPLVARTPRNESDTPMLPPMTVGATLSTPAWEIDQILARLGENRAKEEANAPSVRMQLFTPGPSYTAPSLILRSPLTSTDPRKYASPKKLLFGVNVQDTPSASPSLQSLISPLAAAAGPSTEPGDGSPKKAPVTTIAAKIGRELRAERERTRSGEMRAGV